MHNYYMICSIRRKMTTPTEPSVVEPTPEVTNDDRMWVLLSFIFTPIIPVVMMLMEDKKARPFIKYHAVPALVLGIVIAVVATLLALIPIVGCVSPLLWIIPIVYGIKAYKGVKVDVPVITKFSQDQGWS